MKTCSICAITKPIIEFYSHPRVNKTTGIPFTYFFPYCKECNNQKKRDKDRTRNGCVHTLYLSQTLHSRNRGYAPPTYNEVELRGWLHTLPEFEILFVAWEASGFKSDLKPSCNRLDDYIGYTLANIELTTWFGNKKAWARDCLAGVNRKISRPIKQFSLDGLFIQEFFSINDASRQLDICHPNIIKACTGKRESAGGYQWKYSDPGRAPKYNGFIGGP